MTPKKFAKIYRQSFILALLFVVVAIALFSIFGIFIIVNILGIALIAGGIISLILLFRFWKCATCRRTLPMDFGWMWGLHPNPKIDICPYCKSEVM
ncbi:MAG: hypothetical protein FWC69_05825 [Defluviitaleaceae bacterium]|nr:hypothetical protein [Defluviitaleaceae bacterium]